MEIPSTLEPALKFVGGLALFGIGISYAWKFIQAAFLGKLTYWSGLEKFGFLFIPITWFISPLLLHLPYNTEKTLVKEKQQLWVHLVFGPVFFVFALMFMTSGADLMGLPGSYSLNSLLTFNRTDIPPCIVYTPPSGNEWVGSYRFPFIKKATKVVLRFLTHKIPQDKKDSYNAYEQKGEDVDSYTRGKGDDWFYDDDDKPGAHVEQPVQATNPKPSSGKRK